MLIHHIGLVSQTSEVSLAALLSAAAALQKQVTRDFGPIWSVQATVSAFATLSDVPVGYWPVLIRDDIGFPGAAGIHLDSNGQPYALVQASDSWQLTVSHEVLEMLADPFGNRLVAGTSPKRGQGRVEFLVEVCDPSEAPEFGYTVNGVLVSDFYTPSYFSPVGNPGTRYSFTGAITKPRTILRGGYLSWHDPVSNHWWQGTWFSGSKVAYRDIGVLTGSGSLRSQIDALTPTEVTVPSARPAAGAASMFVAAMPVGSPESEAGAARARSLMAEIQDLKTRLGLG